MAIKITKIEPYVTLTPESNEENAIVAHRNINFFHWVNDQTQQTGSTSRENLYNWIVNQSGKAYVIIGGETIYLFGAFTSAGDRYVRAAKNGAWTNDLFDSTLRGTPAK